MRHEDKANYVVVSKRLGALPLSRIERRRKEY
jgi:hypothetical protein